MAEKKKRKAAKAAKKKKQTPQRKWAKRIGFTVLAVALIGILIGGIRLGITMIEMKGEAVALVSEATRDTFKANQTTLVYDTNGDLITKLKGEKDVYKIGCPPRLLPH